MSIDEKHYYDYYMNYYLDRLGTVDMKADLRLLKEWIAEADEFVGSFSKVHIDTLTRAVCTIATRSEDKNYLVTKVCIQVLEKLIPAFDFIPEGVIIN